MGQFDEQSDFGKGARTDLRILSLHFFDPGMVHRNILQSQFDDSLLQEAGFLLHGIDHADSQVGAGNGQRDRGQAAAATDIEQGAFAQMRQHGQRIEQMVRDGLGWVAQGGQVVGLVPLEQQVAEGEQLVLGRIGQGDSEVGEARREVVWSACWNCGGEHGAVTYTDENRVVIVQR